MERFDTVQLKKLAIYATRLEELTVLSSTGVSRSCATNSLVSVLHTVVL